MTPEGPQAQYPLRRAADGSPYVYHDPFLCGLHAGTEFKPVCPGCVLEELAEQHAAELRAEEEPRTEEERLARQKAEELLALLAETSWLHKQELRALLLAVLNED